MTDLPEITISGINLEKRLAVSDIGYGQIEGYLDKDGEETQDASIATIAIIEWVAGGWSYVEIDQFTETLN